MADAQSSVRRFFVLWAFVLLVAACGEGENTAGDEPNVPRVDDEAGDVADDVQVPEELHVIVAPDSDGRLPADAELHCGGSGAFPASALDDMPLVVDTDILAAMASFLEGGEGSFWPQQDWRLLHEGDEQAIVVHAEPGGEAGVSIITLVRAGDQWQLEGAQSGPCALQPALPSGLNAVDWRLATPAGALTPDTTIVELLITERECVGGEAIGDRLVGPQVVMTDDAVLIAFAAATPPGAHTCPGNPEQSFTVELPEALGQRTVVDGLMPIGDLADYLDAQSAAPSAPSIGDDTVAVLGQQPEVTDQIISPSWVAELGDFEDVPSLIHSVQDGGEAPQVSQTMTEIMIAALSGAPGLAYYYQADTADDLIIAERIDTRLDNGDSLGIAWHYRWADTPPCEVCAQNQTLWDNGWQVWTDTAHGTIRHLAAHSELPVNAEVTYIADPLQWPELLPESNPTLATTPEHARATAATILSTIQTAVPVPTT